MMKKFSILLLVYSALFLNYARADKYLGVKSTATSDSVTIVISANIDSTAEPVDSIAIRLYRDAATPVKYDSLITASLSSYLQSGTTATYRFRLKASDGTEGKYFGTVKAKLKTGWYPETNYIWDVSSAGIFDTTDVLKRLTSEVRLNSNDTINALVLDKTGYSLTASERQAIADTAGRFVWNYSTRTLTTGSGSGANQVILYTRSLSDSTTPLNGVQVQVLNNSQTSTEGILFSSSLGQTVFALNNGTYKVRLFKPNYIFTVPESVMVSGNVEKTFYGSLFDPGLPPQASLCRVYGWIYDINNLPVVGAQIEVEIKTVPVRYQNLLLSPFYKTATTDSNGYWFIDLYPNSILTPDSTKYTFYIHLSSGTILRLEKEVPNQASWQLSW